MGVTVLAVLQLIGGGLVAVVMIGLGSSRRGQIADGIEEIGVTPWFAGLSILMLAVPPLIGGIGMVMDRRWGWWLSGFAHLYRAVLTLQALIVVSSVFDAASLSPEESTRVGVHITKYGGRVVIASLIYMYLMRGHVMAYFGVDDHSRKPVILQQVTVCAVIFGLSWLFGWKADV